MTSLQEIENFLDIEIGDKRLRPGKKNPNKNKYYYYPDQYYIVMLTQGKYMIAEDCKKTRTLLRLNYWWICSHGYATTTSKRWHQKFLQYENGLVCDHINNKRYDNRHENLRIVSSSQNNRNRSMHSNNTSGKQGVCRYVDKKNNLSYWMAFIAKGKGRTMKYFSVKKLGDEYAKRQAIEWRREKELELGYIGE